MLKFLPEYKSRFRILKGGKISLVISAVFGSVVIAHASPSGGTVTSGSAAINQSGTTTTINQSTDKASINWTSFSVAADETVNFVQPDTSSITLNRVIGTEKSVIDGALNANGQVWILNSNGILFNSTAKVNTAGLLATTAQLNDADFQAGNYNFTNATSNSVINVGTIEVSNSGSVVLASNEVVNEGTIKAVRGKVHLVGADSYSLNLNGNSLVNLTVDKGVLDALVSNSGHIIADGGEIYLTTNAVNELLKGVVNNTGIIEANSIDSITGKVELFAHGGEVQVGGTIEVKDGFVETSGKDFTVESDAKIIADTWLIDPTDIIITDAASYETSLNAGTDVNIEADNDIRVQDSISKTSGTDATLTFKAGRHIELESGANITSTSNKLNILFWADSDNSGDGINKITATNISTNGGYVKFGNNQTATINGVSTLVGGDVYFNGASAQTISTAGGAIDIYGETILANTSGLTLNSNGGDVSFHGLLNSGNSYSYVSGYRTWTSARTDATSGNTGLSSSDVGYSYLVAIGSRLENAIAGIETGYQGSWIGAYRDKDNVLGNGDTAWYWADAPQNSTEPFFYQGGSATSYYNNFGSGEPNGTGTSGEYAGQFFGSAGQWNDIQPDRINSSSQYDVYGYVKETNLANSSLTINAGSGDVTFEKAVGNSKTLDSLTVTGNDIVFNGAVTLGSNTVTLDAASTVTDGVNGYIQAGNLKLLDGAVTLNHISNDVDIIAASGIDSLTFTDADDLQIGTIDSISSISSLGDISLTATTVTGSEDIALASGHGLTITQSGDSTYSGVISGTDSSFTKAGAGALTLTGDNTYTGATTISAGTLQIGNGGTTGSISTTSGVTNNGTLKYYLGEDRTVGYAIDGTGNVEVQGSASLLFGDLDATNNAGFLTITGQTIATDTTVLDVLERIAGARMNGGAVNSVDSTYDDSLEAGVYNKSYDSSTNTATFQTQMYFDGGSGNQWTKVVFVKLTQNGNDVQAQVYQGRDGNYAVYAAGDVRGNDFTTSSYNNGMAVATYAGDAGYGVDQLFSSSKVTLTQDNTYSGTTTISNTTTNGSDTNSGNTAYFTRTALGILELGNGSTTGNIENSTSIVDDGVLIFNRSDDFSTNGDISGSGKITKLNNNTTIIKGTHTYTGKTTIDDGTLIVQDDSSDPTTSIFEGKGKLVLQPDSDDFSSTFTLSNMTFTTSLTGLTIGKATSSDGTSDVDVNLNSAIDINGPVNVYGGNIAVNQNIDTQGGAANGDVLLKASGDIALATTKSITTDSGDVILWSNSDGQTTDGSIFLRKDSSITTNGGNLWLGGGNGTATWNGLTVGNGYAVGGTTVTALSGAQNSIKPAIFLEDSSINTSGGDIAMFAKQVSTDDSSNYGFLTNGTNNIDAGSGKVNIDTQAIGGRYATVFGYDNSTYASTTNITSSNADTDAIIISSDSTSGTNHATTVEGDVTVSATNGGGITYEAFSQSTIEGLRVGYGTSSSGYLYLLANSGDITLNTGLGGILLPNASTDIFLGAKAGKPVTSSTSNIDFLSDKISATGALHFDTYGTVDILSHSTAFTSAFDISTLDYSSTITGLTVGKTTNNQDIIIGDAAINGDLIAYGQNIAVNGAVNVGIHTVKLDGSGTVTDGASGYIVADKLALLDGAVTLDNVLNDVNTIAAESTDSFTYVDKDDLIIGTVNPTGITSSGAVDIATLTGDLTVSENISGSSVTLNAGKSESAGTSTGGNILISGSPTITATSGNTKLYTGSISGSTGITSMVGSGSGNFRYNSDETATNYTTALGATGTYAIYREQPTVSGTISDETITYGDNAPSFTMSGTSAVNGDSTSATTVSGATYSAINKIDAGSYSVTAQGFADLGYDISSVTNGTLTVNKAALSVTASNDAKFVTQSDAASYNGVTYSGFVGGETSSVLGGTLAYNRTNAGTETAGTYSDVIEASGLTSSNYDITYENGDYTIVEADELLVRVTDVVNTYGAATSYAIAKSSYWDSAANGGAGGEIVLAAATDNGSNNFTVDDGSGGSATFTVTPSSSSYSTANLLAVGSYQVGYTGLNTVNGGNFNNTVHIIGSHQVDQKGLTASATNVSKIYDGTTSMSGVSIGLDALETNDVVTVEGTGAFSSKNAGTGLDYTINNLALSGTDAGNYYLTAGTTLSGSNGEITKADATVTANSDTQTYNGTSQSVSGFTASGLVNGETTAVLDGVSGATASGTNAGTYNTSLAGTDENYNLTFVDGSLVITKADATVTANSDTQTYNGTSQSVSGFTASGLVNGETTAVLDGVSGATASGTNAGTYNTSLAGTDENYNLTFVDGSLVITKADATVTANSDTQTYNGTSQSVSGFTASGLVNGETTAVLDGVSGATASGTNAGTYNTSLAGTDENYNLTFVDGSLVITKADATVTANSDTQTYNGTSQSVSGFTASGLVNGETTAVLDGVSGATASGTDAGTYNTSLAGTDENYNLTFVDGSLVITKANVTVTANSFEKMQGQNDPSFTYDVTGLRGSDTLSGSLTRQIGETVGQYLISQGTLASSSNYTMTFSNGILTIKSNVDPNQIITVPVVVVNKPITNTQEISLSEPATQSISTGNEITTASMPIEGQPTLLVSLDEIKREQGIDSGSNEDIIVPLSKSSLIKLHNGGLRLLPGQQQLLFVVNNEENEQ